MPCGLVSKSRCGEGMVRLLEGRTQQDEQALFVATPLAPQVIEGVL